ncbi:MAG: electron transfer flavoprotein subunit alpha/FixB family protein [Candidatus Eisenbacteria bacterium]
MAQTILVIAEQREGEIRKVTYEALSEASRIAQATGGEVAALLMGSNVKDKAGSLSHYGARAVFVADDDRLATYSGQAYCDVVRKVCDDVAAGLIVMPATATGKDLAPRLAARLRAGLASDVIAVEASDGGLVVTRPVYAGKALVNLSITSKISVISLRPNVMEISEPDLSITTESKDVDLGGLLENVGTKVIETKKPTSGRPDVSEADIIVSGGRGLKAPEHFSMIEDLADLLGAAVGASRPAVDSGWRDHQDQVGQTGKTVTPDLYIACGISGAIQHLAGMSSSKCIVAINKDPEAPIFGICDYGLVGDVFEIVPLITQECKDLKSGA